MPLFGPPNVKRLAQKKNIRGLIKALNYKKDKYVRLDAAKALNKYWAKEAVPALLCSLGDPFYKVSSKAKEAIRTTRWTFEDVIQAISQSNSNQLKGILSFVNAQMKTPPENPGRMIDHVIPLLKDDDPEVRKESVWLLEKLGDPRAAGALAPLLADRDQDVCKMTIHALGELGNPCAAPALIPLLKDPDTDIRGPAAKALGRIGDPRMAQALIPLLVDADHYVRNEAVGALQTMKWTPETIKDRVKLLAAQNRWEEIVQLGQSAIPTVMTLLRNASGAIRSGAVRTLGQLGDPRAVDALLPFLQDPDSFVRIAAAEALGAFDDPRIFPALAPLLEDPKGDMRSTAAKALGRSGDPQAVLALMALLKDPQTGVRESAAEALMHVGKAAAPALIKALNNPMARSDRRRALEALGEIGDARAIPVLAEALEDGDWTLRRIAAQGLDKLGWQPETTQQKTIFAIGLEDWNTPPKLGSEAVAILISALEEPSLRIEAIRALEKIGEPRALDALLPLLTDSGEEVFAEVTKALENNASPKTVPVFIKALVNQPPSSSLRDVLCHLGKPALPALMDVLKNGEPRMQVVAIEVMGKIGEAQTLLPVLTEALKTGHPSVQESAIQMMGELGDQSAIPILKDVLRTGAWPLRFAAASALAKLEWAPMSFKEKALFALCQQQWDRVWDLGQIAVDPLIHLLQDDLMRHQDLLRIKAIEALVQIGDERALDVLLDCLDLKHTQREIRIAAAKALISFYQQGKLSRKQKERILQNKPAIVNADHRDTQHHHDGYYDCTNNHTDCYRHIDSTTGLKFPR